MRGDLSRDGWQYYSLPEVRKCVEKVAAKKELFLRECTGLLSSRFGMSFDRYDPSKGVEIGMMKSVVRSLLRYDADMLGLAAAIYAHASPLLTQRYGELYAAPPYPYIHLPQDLSEFSKMHLDHASHAGKFLTIWVPLNPCRHKPISIIPRSQAKWSAVRVLNAVERRLGLGELPWFHERIVSPDVDLGDFMAWDGRTHHSGNLNESDRTHVAVNFRLASSPHALEPSVQQKHFGPGALGDPGETSAATLLETYFSVFESVRKAAAPVEKDLDAGVRRTLELVESWKLDRALAVRCAYGITLGCIRRDSFDPEVARWNLAASLLSDEYLWSLNSFFQFAARHHSPEALGRLLELLGGRFRSRHMEITLRNLAAKHKIPARLATLVPTG